MRTIGFRSNVLFAIAAAFGVIAALGRPWYGPSGAPDAGRMEDLFGGIGRAFTASDGTTGWAALRDGGPADRRAGRRHGGCSLLLTLVPPLQLAPAAARPLERARDRRRDRGQADRRARRERAERAAPGPAGRARRGRACCSRARRRSRPPRTQAQAASKTYTPPPAPEYAPESVRPAAVLVLRAADAAQAVLQVRRVLDDLGEADDGDRVLERDVAPVDLLHEVDELLGAAELGVVVLDVAR